MSRDFLQVILDAQDPRKIRVSACGAELLDFLSWLAGPEP